MPSVQELVACIERFAPLNYQESYDNSGLQIGSRQMKVTGVLLTLDITEEVIEEAIANGQNLIVAHHPLIFSGIKRITGNNDIERAVIKAIKNDIALYACHTNIDAVTGGVSFKMAEKLGLSEVHVLKPISGDLCKIVCFVPSDFSDEVRNAMFEAGAGHIGNYSHCSFNLTGEGSFKAEDNTNPFVGRKGELHNEREVRIETVFAKKDETRIIAALKSSHPYEEVAYDIYALNNLHEQVGAGALGTLAEPMNELEFIQKLKSIFGVSVVRHTNLRSTKVSKVALCGGSGSFLLRDAIKAGADIFVSGDFKYHQFFEAEKNIVIADIGHFESEQFTLEIFYDILIKNFPNFAIRFTKVKTNPINYC